MIFWERFMYNWTFLQEQVKMQISALRPDDVLVRSHLMFWRL